MAKQDKCKKALEEVAEAANRAFTYELRAKSKTHEQIIQEGREASRRVHEWMVERREKGKQQ